jgi:hypothetical protein
VHAGTILLKALRLNRYLPTRIALKKLGYYFVDGYRDRRPVY